MVRSSLLLHPLIVVSGIALSGSVAPLSPGAALSVATLWLAVFAALNRLRVKQLVVLIAGALVLFVTTGARSTGALHEFKSRYELLRSQLPGPARCSGIAQVTRSPVIRTRESSPPQSAEREQVVLWTGRAESLDCEGTKIIEKVPLRIYGGPNDLSRGDRVEFIAQLGMVRLFRNASLPDPWPGAARRGHLLSGSALLVERLSSSPGLEGIVDRKRAHVRARISKTYSEAATPMGRALVLGENDLAQDEAEAFRQSGLLHLLAVSGTHLVIAVLAFVSALGALLVRIETLTRRFDVRRFSSALGALLSLLYADFSGGSGSAWRAAFMLCVVCGGRALGLKVKGASALGSSILIGLCVDPLMGSDYSFLLSALATSGLIGLGQPLSVWLNRGILKWTGVRQLTLSLVATISSTLPCAPVLALMDGDMTFAALFANVVAAPLGELIALPACLLHTVATPLRPLEEGLALVGSGSLQLVRQIALWSASVEGAQFPVPFPSPRTTALLMVSLLLLSGWFAQKERCLRTKACVLGAVALGGTSISITPIQTSTLAVTTLDVGQGDAILIDFPDGKVGLMDGGGFVTGMPDTGERVILPVLRARGVKHLDLMILSHAHPDHILGLLSVAEAVPVSQLWLPHAPKRKEGYVNQLARSVEERGGQVFSSEQLCGTRSFGGATIHTLAPCDEEFRSLGANDASLVVKLSLGSKSALLTGDIEGPAERLLVQTQSASLQTDLLKVAHHGSDTSSHPEFITHARPNTAFISSGVRNRFKHPRPGTLQTLTERRIAILRTDRLGSLTWRTDGAEAWTHSFSSTPPAEYTGDFHGEAYLHPRGALSPRAPGTSLSP